MAAAVTELGIAMVELGLFVWSGLLFWALVVFFIAGDQQAEMQKQESQMMQMHQTMMADMKAMDDKLNTLVTKMNAATGEAKVDAIADRRRST